MDMSRHKEYLTFVEAERRRHNCTRWHVPNLYYEHNGAVGEMAARMFLSLPEVLHTHFDGGADLYYRGYAVDIKTTKLTSCVEHRYLQWPQGKPIKADIVWMWAVHGWEAFPIGWAWKEEMIAAPINYGRERPCHEIPVPRLHPIYELYSLRTLSQLAKQTLASLSAP